VRAQQLHWLYDSLIVAIIAAFSLCIPLQIMVFVMPMFISPMRAISLKGRPFAYNPRNVPSEGFTSLLYMLLLVPTELPTGFHGKVCSSELGAGYVQAWLNDYHSLVPFALIAFGLLSGALRKQRTWLVLLLTSALSIVLFYAQMAPLSAAWLGLRLLDQSLGTKIARVAQAHLANAQ
jgi:hypothetical protein